jgi:hypothetical protein
MDQQRRWAGQLPDSHTQTPELREPASQLDAGWLANIDHPWGLRRSDRSALPIAASVM